MFSAVKEAWQTCSHDVLTLQSLTAAVDELSALLRCRKAFCDEGMKSLLEHLKSMQTYYVSNASIFMLILFLCKQFIVLLSVVGPVVVLS